MKKMAEFSCDACIYCTLIYIIIIKHKVHSYKSAEGQIWKKHPNVVFQSLSSSQRFDWIPVFALHETCVMSYSAILCDALYLCICGDGVCLLQSFVC